jgi:ATP-dependent Zn protease
MKFIPIDEFYDQIEKEALENDTNTCNMWLQSGSKIYPSENSKILPKLDSGIYKVFNNQQDGIHLKRESINTDELFTFTDDKASKLLLELDKFWSQKEDYKKHKIVHKRGVLLEGEPGTGKSSIITIIAKDIIEEGGLMFIVNSLEEFNILETYIRLYFKKIEPNREIIIVIEGLEELNNSEKLLDLLDGKSSISGCLIIGTANNCTELSSALLRPGRFDRRIHIGFPQDEIRKQYFENKGIEEEELELFVNKSKNFSFAHLKEMVIAVKLLGADLEEVVARLKKSGEKKDYTENLNSNDSSFF